MTISDVVENLGGHPVILICVFVLLPIVSIAFGKTHRPGQGGRPPHKYIYAILVYAGCIPGVFACVITGYSLFFIRANLLSVNVLVYFLPIVSMVVTLLMIRKRVDLDEVPGFDRLVGLCTLVAITAVISFLLLRLRFFVGSFAPITTLLIIGGFVFVLLKWAAHTVFRGRKAPKTDPPDFPEM